VAPAEYQCTVDHTPRSQMRHHLLCGILHHLGLRTATPLHAGIIHNYTSLTFSGNYIHPTIITSSCAIADRPRDASYHHIISYHHKLAMAPAQPVLSSALQ